MTDHINWYPGHMKKTRELIEEHMKMVDCVCEILDARIPRSSQNPIIEELTSAKPRIILLGKADLADQRVTKQWIRHWSNDDESKTALAVNCMRGEGIKNLLRALEQKKKERSGSRAAKPFRLMVVGVPNVGKSSLINRLTGKKAAQVGNRPGVTKGKQWLTLNNGMQLLDTPGILWPKFEDPQVGRNLAFCGSIKDEILDIADLALELVQCLAEQYQELLLTRYKIEEETIQQVMAQSSDPALAMMEEIAKGRGFLMSGGRIDYERCAHTILDEFREGKIGRITLERP